MKSLKGTIFVFFVVLLLAVQGVFLRIIYNAARQQESNQVQHQLDMARTLFQTHFESRRDYLAAFAETAARDFGLKQVFQEDTRSFLVALNNHRQRIGADLAMAVTAEGTISAQLVSTPQPGAGERVAVGPEQQQVFRFPQWLEIQDHSRLYPLDGDYYQLSLAPLTSGALVVGWIGFGYNIDRSLAAYFAELTGLSTDFVLEDGGRWSVLASSRTPAGEAPGAEENALVNRIMAGGPDGGIIATTHPLGESGERRLATVMYGDRTDLLMEIRKSWWQLGLLAALTLSASLGGAFVIATRISRPVQELVKQARQIAGGKYDQAFNIGASGELGALAEEFRHMQEAVLSREKLISHQAWHDSLTGLPNRNRLLHILEQRCLDPLAVFSVAKLCIRRIEEVNSTLGHDIGDEVLRTVAQRLRAITAPDALFHLGGSEFVVLLDHVSAEQADAQVILLARLMEPKFRYQSISLYIELQVGMSLYPLHDRAAAGLLLKASTALQHAKKSGRPFQLYQTALSSENVEQLQLIDDLKSAIEQEQLSLHYQPKLDLARDQVRQVEALVRWRHPEKGMIPPDKFVGVAEQTGLINALTRWVLLEAAAQHRRWREKGIELSVAVNISAQNLRDSHFYDSVMESLKKTELAREAISLEMTERAVVEDLDAAIAVLSRFEAGNIHLAIDDFGTGYSSLSQLKRLPVSELKIDRSFILGLPQDRENQIIVRSTVELAHNMGLRVVAEGVEDEATLRWLRGCGCDQAQGYHICRPKPAGDLGKWLRESGRLPAPAADRLHSL